MITRHWGFKAYGPPQPKGSLKCIGARGPRKHVLIEDNADSAPWREHIAGVARSWVKEQADPHQPIEVDVSYFLTRPAGHYGTGRNRHKLKLSAPVWPATKGTGDEDKLRRLVLDALQDAGVLRDDAQVQGGRNYKHYADKHPGELPGVRWDEMTRAGLVVHIRPLGNA